MSKSLNQSSGGGGVGQQYAGQSQHKIGQNSMTTSGSTQKPKTPEYRLRVRPDIILGRLIEGNELQQYEQNVAQQLSQLAVLKHQQ